MSFDFLLAAVLILSSITAFARGGVREATSAYSFLGASLITYFSSEWLFSTFSGMMALGVVLAIWFVIFVVITTAQAVVSQNSWLGTDIGLFDRIVGLVYGVFRGVVQGALLFLLLAQAEPGGQGERWVSASWSYPIVATTARAVSALVEPSENAADAFTFERQS